MSTSKENVMPERTSAGSLIITTDGTAVTSPAGVPAGNLKQCRELEPWSESCSTPSTMSMDAFGSGPESAHEAYDATEAYTAYLKFLDRLQRSSAYGSSNPGGSYSAVVANLVPWRRKYWRVRRRLMQRKLARLGHAKKGLAHVCLRRFGRYRDAVDRANSEAALSSDEWSGPIFKFIPKAHHDFAAELVRSSGTGASSDANGESETIAGKSVELEDDIATETVPQADSTVRFSPAIQVVPAADQSFSAEGVTPVLQEQHGGSSSFSDSPIPLQNQNGPEESWGRSFSRSNVVAEKMLELEVKQHSSPLSQHAQKMSNLGLDSSMRIPKTSRREGLDEIYDTILGTPALPMDGLKHSFEEYMEKYVTDKSSA
ncbi:unnamed protein product [Calypogeia fissa]